MKFLVQLLCLAVAAALGLTIGFGFRLLKVGANPHSPELRASIATRSDDSRKSSFVAGRKMMVDRAQDDSLLTTQLERTLSMSSRVIRWLCWLEAIEKASLPDFPRLAGLAKGDATATWLVASRWV